jgi:hypothetical protein
MKTIVEMEMEGSDNNQMDTDAFSSLRSCEGAGHLGVRPAFGGANATT